MATPRRSKRSSGSALPQRAKNPNGIRLWPFAALLLIAGALAYSTSFSGGFMGDDADAIANNPNIKSLWPLRSAMTAPNDTTLAGRPVASLTFALNYALAPYDVRNVMAPDPAMGDTLFLANVWGYHAFNLGVHLLAGLALFGVLRRTLMSPPLRDRFGRLSAPLAFATAIIWIVHPLQTESVTFLVQRVESLMGLFLLTALYCAIRAAESDFRESRWTIGAIAACALGMGTKEAMVVAPLIVALWIWVCRPDLKLIGPPRVLLAGLALTWLIPAWLVMTISSRSLSAGFGLGDWTWWLYLRTQAEVIVHYLRLAFWPHPLVFHYGWLPAPSWSSALPELLLLGSLGIASAIALAKRRPIGFAGAWFFLILAPSSSILPIPSEVAAEHRMYLPLAAVIALTVVGLCAAARRFAGGDPPAASATAWARAGWVAVSVLVLVFGWQTLNRNRVYANAQTMTADVVKSRPQNAQAQLAHAIDLIGARSFTEAESHLREAISHPLPPGTDPVVPATMRMDLGLVLCTLSRFPECVDALKQAITIDPRLDAAFNMLGDAELSLRQPREALEAFGQASALTPNNPMPFTRMAWILATSSNAAIRDGAKAVQYAEQAVSQTKSGDVSALDALGAAYAEAGRYDDAREALQRAIALVDREPGNPFGPVLRDHLNLIEGRRPIRTAEW
ncbi:MAG TPA: tetratricopeptide repeat protein [Vicinamibacterales bacterium]|nr:tetratricopeptide repeat protein [Vicinamibacterales bacterium]